MSRPLQDEPFEALERRLAETETDREHLIAILHELSFRDGPQAALLKERAEQAWIQQTIARAKREPAIGAAPGGAAAAQRTQSAARTHRDRPTGGRAESPRDDVPGFDPGPMLSEVTTLRSVRKTEETWRDANRHLAILAISAIGIVALASAHLAGAFQSKTGVAVQVYPEPRTVREVAQLPYIPMGVSGGGVSGGGVPGGGAAGAAAAPGSGGINAAAPVVVPPTTRMNLTADIANMYSGEGPQIARAAVAAAGLGLNETVRWRNDKTGRYGAITLIAQNPQRANCYTARITRLDTKTPQRRTQQLCF